MVHPKIFAWFREKALFVLAYTLRQLFFTGRMAEIGCRAAHIMDIALKIRFPGKGFCLVDNGFMAPRLNNSPLVEGQSAKTASAKTAPIADQTELHLFNGRNAAGRFVGRMVGPHIIQAVNPVHLRRGQRFRRRILNHIKMLAIFFDHTLTAERVCIYILGIKALRIFAFALFNIIKRRKRDGIIDRI